MKGSIETMISIILLTLMTVLGSSYIIAGLNTQRAQNYHSAIVTEIEASEFSDNVITECQNKAKNDGYKELTIKKYTSVETGRTYAKVVLDYNYAIPILNIFLTHEITGYAR